MNPLGEAHICCLHTVVSHLYVTNTRFVEDPLTEGRQSTESHDPRSKFLQKIASEWTNLTLFCPERAENGGWLILNMKKRIENAYTQCGRIANSPERRPTDQREAIYRITRIQGVSSCKKSQATERTTLCYMIFAEKVLPLQVGL